MKKDWTMDSMREGQDGAQQRKDWAMDSLDEGAGRASLICHASQQFKSEQGAKTPRLSCREDSHSSVEQ
jgi:hypothetical protein